MVSLTDILIKMNFVDNLTVQGQETRLGAYLRQQRPNLLFRYLNEHTKMLVPETDDSMKNLLKVCCSIMNLRPIQRGQNQMDPKLLNNYMQKIDLNASDKDVLVLEQFSIIKSLINRHSFYLNQMQV